MSEAATPGATPPAVRVTGVRKAFDREAVLRDVSLTVPAGTCTAILGPSGCGKTTLLRIVAGLESADGGRVEVGGVVTDDPSARVPPERRRVGLLFQDLALWPHMTVGQALRFVLESSGARKGEREERLLAAVEAVRLPTSLLERRPAELSGGERQRAALARALVQRPLALLLDEPLSGLDRHLRIHLLSTLRSLGERQGLGMLVVTHDREEAFALADRVVLLEGGVVAQEGTPREVYDTPASRFVAEFVGAASLLPVSQSGAGGRTALSGVTLPADSNGPLLAVYRPEGIRIAEDGPCGARVADCFYRGDHWMIRLQLTGDGALEVLLRSDRPVARGVELRLRADPPALVAGSHAEVAS